MAQAFYLLLISLISVSSEVWSAESPKIRTVHARALHGDPAYPVNFTHFKYAEPLAPKGGTLRLGVNGTFDTFNAFAGKGVAAGVTEYIYDSLMQKSRDEPYSIYGLIARTMEYPEDNSWVAFELNRKARFSDGKPITAKDVVYTFEQFTRDDIPAYKSLLSGVEQVKAESKHKVIFYIEDKSNRELPLRLAQLPILPEHRKLEYDFKKADLSIPLSSGPYRISQFETARKIILERVPDYWAAEHPVNKGRFNFDKIQYEYFRNSTISLQAFLAGSYDIRVENLAKNWAVGYQGNDVDAGLILRSEYPRITSQVQSFVFNTRKSRFQDRRVREAVSQAYDFQWTNSKLLFGNYKQPTSLFANSILGQRGTPSNSELQLLNPFREQLPSGLFQHPWAPVVTDGSGNIRRQLLYASQLLKEAGWVRRNNQLVHSRTGEPFHFDLLLATPEQERIALPFKRNLQQLGITMQVKNIDLSQYIQRVREHDYDMLLRSFIQTDAPGNEQKEYWGSASADRPGSQNMAGVSNPAVDSLVEAIIEARDRNQLISATRALDRVLLWEHYTIPQIYMPYWRVAHRRNFTHPEKQPLFGYLDLSIWWEKPKQ